MSSVHQALYQTRQQGARNERSNLMLLKFYPKQITYERMAGDEMRWATEKNEANVKGEEEDNGDAI